MIEVLKQALEALYPISHNNTDDYRGQADKAITSLRQTIAEFESQKPFAYVNVEMRRLEFATDYVKWDTPTTIKLDKIPLYTHPPQHTEQNFCSRCGKRTKDIHTCTPPQRTWVGLDHHDKKKFSSWLDHKTDDEVFTAIEAKLKELNG